MQHPDPLLKSLEQKELDNLKVMMTTIPAAVALPISERSKSAHHDTQTIDYPYISPQQLSASRKNDQRDKVATHAKTAAVRRDRPHPRHIRPKSLNVIPHLPPPPENTKSQKSDNTPVHGAEPDIVPASCPPDASSKAKKSLAAKSAPKNGPVPNKENVCPRARKSATELHAASSHEGGKNKKSGKARRKHNPSEVFSIPLLDALEMAGVTGGAGGRHAEVKITRPDGGCVLLCR